jgi:hypothetical protein
MFVRLRIRFAKFRIQNFHLRHNFIEWRISHFEARMRRRQVKLALKNNRLIGWVNKMEENVF